MQIPSTSRKTLSSKRSTLNPKPKHYTVGCQPLPLALKRFSAEPYATTIITKPKEKGG